MWNWWYTEYKYMHAHLRAHKNRQQCVKKIFVLALSLSFSLLPAVIRSAVSFSVACIHLCRCCLLICLPRMHSTVVLIFSMWCCCWWVINLFIFSHNSYYSHAVDIFKPFLQLNIHRVHACVLYLCPCACALYIFIYFVYGFLSHCFWFFSICHSAFP